MARSGGNIEPQNFDITLAEFAYEPNDRHQVILNIPVSLKMGRQSITGLPQHSIP